MLALAVRIYRHARLDACDATAEGAQRPAHAASKQMFAFSILYLFLLFAMLLVDQFVPGCSATCRAHDAGRDWLHDIAA